MIGSGIWLLVVGAAMLSPKPLHVYMGKTFCQVSNVVNVFSVSSGYGYGGVAIALVRTILIKNPFNMASKIGSKKGKRKIILLLCLTLLLMSAGTVYIWTNVSRKANIVYFSAPFYW